MSVLCGCSYAAGVASELTLALVPGSTGGEK